MEAPAGRFLHIVWRRYCVAQQPALSEGGKVDLIIAVDASGGMTQENNQLMDFLYSGLVQPMVQDGIDLQTIIVARFGDTPPELCFEQPLGGIPFGACDFSPTEPVNSSDFRHFSVNIQSFNAWCRLLEGYDGSLADDFNQAPAGWSTWLRQDAFKKILVVTNDRVNCTLNGEIYFGDLISLAEATAASFDSALLGLSSAQFGTSSARKYMDRTDATFQILGSG